MEGKRLAIEAPRTLARSVISMLSSRQAQLAASCARCCRLRWIASKSDQLAAVKALREQSGAPISDVKAALVEADWKPGDRACTACHAAMHASSPVVKLFLCLSCRWPACCRGSDGHAAEEGSRRSRQEGALLTSVVAALHNVRTIPAEYQVLHAGLQDSGAGPHWLRAAGRQCSCLGRGALLPPKCYCR